MSKTGRGKRLFGSAPESESQRFLAVCTEISDPAQHPLTCLLVELPLKQAVKLTAEITGENKNALYQLALDLKTEGDAG